MPPAIPALETAIPAPPPSTLAAPEPRAEGATSGVPRALLRLEGAIALVAALAAYRALGGHWGWLAGLFLVPDLSMLGYLAGPRVGAIAYNAGHTYLGPAALVALHLLGAPEWTLFGALIWVAHIGFDRMLGYGLKYERFGATHLGRIGRAPRPD